MTEELGCRNACEEVTKPLTAQTVANTLKVFIPFAVGFDYHRRPQQTVVN